MKIQNRSFYVFEFGVLPAPLYNPHPGVLNVYTPVITVYYAEHIFLLLLNIYAKSQRRTFYSHFILNHISFDHIQNAKNALSHQWNKVFY